MGLFLPEDKIGRSGLTDIDVNPVVFLQLKTRLEKGENLPFNKEQLLRAFSAYLRDHKGKWAQDTFRDVKNLESFAQKYVRENTVLLQQKQQNVAPQDRKQTAKDFLHEQGMTPMDVKKVPENLRNQKLTPEQRRDNALVTIDLAMDLIQIATSAQPAVAAALVLVAHGLVPSATEIVFKGCDILFDKLEKRAGTEPEKESCIHTLEIVRSAIDPKIYHDKIEELQNKEHNMKINLRLENLKGTENTLSVMKRTSDEIVRREKDDSAQAKPEEVKHPQQPVYKNPLVMPPKPTASFFKAILGDKHSESDT